MKGCTFPQAALADMRRGYIVCIDAFYEMRKQIDPLLARVIVLLSDHNVDRLNILEDYGKWLSWLEES